MLWGNDRHHGTPFSVSAERNADMFIDLAHRRPDAPGDVLGHLIAYADTGVSQNFSDRLLRQPLESGGLCMNCHVVPKHQFNSNHGSMWAGLPCLQCHVDVHGSYESRHLLDPGLAAQGCFAAGCHQL